MVVPMVISMVVSILSSDYFNLKQCGIYVNDFYDKLYLKAILSTIYWFPMLVTIDGNYNQ